MNKEIFVKNIKYYCEKRNTKPTVACRESGVGTSFINNIEKRGQTPSVEKVQLLAQYLGVTVSELLGETGPPEQAAPAPVRQPPPPDEVLLRSPPFIRLTVDEVDMIEAYRKADDDTRTIVDAALRKYKQKEKSASGSSR